MRNRLALGIIAASLVAGGVASAEPTLRVQPTTARPGDAVLVTVAGATDVPRGKAAGRSLQFFRAKSGYQAVFAVPLDAKPERISVDVVGVEDPATVVVRFTPFTETDVVVEEEYANPPADVRPQIEADNAAILAALRQAEGDPQFNYDRVAQAFGGRPVFLLDDSGPPMSDTYLTPCLQRLVRDTWKLDDTLPADCTACRQPDGGGLVNLATYLGMKYPALRQGLITSNRDGTIRTFYGFGYPSCTSPTIPMPEGPFAAGVTELTQLLEPYPSFRAYVIDSAEHVWLLDPMLGNTQSGGVGLTDWLRGLLEGGSDWETVTP